MAETYATDSYQNLLFSLIMYHTRTGHWPKHITVVSHEFKRARFMGLHRMALQWPERDFTFIGLNPPEDITPVEGLIASETANRRLWLGDLYGVKDPLAQKRRKRGWQGRESLDAMILDEAYMLDSEVLELCQYDGGDNPRDLLQGLLPWASRS